MNIKDKIAKPIEKVFDYFNWKYLNSFTETSNEIREMEKLGVKPSVTLVEKNSNYRVKLDFINKSRNKLTKYILGY